MHYNRCHITLEDGLENVISSMLMRLAYHCLPEQSNMPTIFAICPDGTFNGISVYLLLCIYLIAQYV
jgi:hypothetical protein